MSMYQECSTCHRYECVCGDDLDNTSELDGTEHDHLARLEAMIGGSRRRANDEALSWAVKTIRKSKVDAIFFADCIVKRDKTIREQEARIAELSQPYVDERGVSWNPPTAWAYAAACKALHEKAEEVKRLREELYLKERTLTDHCNDQAKRLVEMRRALEDIESLSRQPVHGSAAANWAIAHAHAALAEKGDAK